MRCVGPAHTSQTKYHDYLQTQIGNPDGRATQSQLDHSVGPWMDHLVRAQVFLFRALARHRCWCQSITAKKEQHTRLLRSNSMADCASLGMKFSGLWSWDRPDVARWKPSSRSTWFHSSHTTDLCSTPKDSMDTDCPSVWSVTGAIDRRSPGEDKPNKKYYDPRACIRSAEEGESASQHSLPESDLGHAWCHSGGGTRSHWEQKDSWERKRSWCFTSAPSLIPIDLPSFRTPDGCIGALFNSPPPSVASVSTASPSPSPPKCVLRPCKKTPVPSLFWRFLSRSARSPPCSEWSSASRREVEV